MITAIIPLLTPLEGVPEFPHETPWWAVWIKPLQAISYPAALLVLAQAQQQQIEDLTARMAALETRLTSMEV